MPADLPHVPKSIVTTGSRPAAPPALAAPQLKRAQPGVAAQPEPGIDTAAVAGARARLHQLRAVMRTHFVAREDAIDALLYGVIAHQPVLFIGRPGSGKTQLLSTFCALLGVDTDAQHEQPQLFHYLLTEFTVPEELFGYPDLQHFTAQGVFRRDDRGMIHNADVVFLDEVFNASSANLNALLSLLQERCFYDRGRRVAARFRVFVGATQEPPAHAELNALYDRFTIRIGTNWVDDDHQLDMLQRGLGQQSAPLSPVASLADIDVLIHAVRHRLAALQHELRAPRAVPKATPGAAPKATPAAAPEAAPETAPEAAPEAAPKAAVERYLRLVRHLRSLGVMISDRKIVNFCAVLAARAVLDGDDDPFAPQGLDLLRFAVSDPADGTVLELLQRALDLTSETGAAP